jgi:hypothetical protein
VRTAFLRASRFFGVRSKAAAPFGYGDDFVQPSLKREEKRMRKAISVSALLLALTCTIHAGDMQNGVPSPPPQPQSVTQEAQTSGGDVACGELDGFTEALLSVIESALALL